LLHQTAGENIAGHLRVPRVVYCGFDPTNEALTIGNFMPLKLLAHWQRAGHTPLVVMGGGTGMIGDPSGKSAERQLLTAERVQANIDAQRPTFERVLDFSPALPNRAVILNNAEWLGRLGFIEALRDIGKHFSVNQMIARDSVAARLHSREQGISYTEFSYVLLQAWDCVHLFRTHGCTVQAGGSDQYGNIVSGMDLVRRLDGAETFGVTAPLLLNRDGSKIGKSERGAVFLSANRTSPWAFHQFWLNIADDEVGRSLRYFTFMSREEIEELERRHDAARGERHAQRVLAAAMTDLMHGPSERQRAEQAAEALFSGQVQALDEAALHEVFAEVPHSAHPRAALEGEGVALVDVLAQSTLASSRREAKEFLASGAVSVNGEKAALDRRLLSRDLLHGRIILLRRGRRQWHATRWEA
jgi:tyrosyl-tRNA synthetase